MRERDHSLETLLSLHGEIYDQGDGYWIKVEAWQVEENPHVPHGIRYSVTLHNRYGTRLLGYDNAHAVKLSRRNRYPAGASPTTTSTEMPRIKAYPTISPAPTSFYGISSMKSIAC